MNKFDKFKDSLYSMYGLFASDRTYITGMTNGTTGLRVTIAVGSEEPVDYDLPLGTLWLYTNISSAKFKTLYKRISLQPDPVNGGFQHTWIEILDYDSIWKHMPFDSDFNIDFSLATTEDLGISKLSFPSTDPAHVVVNDDPRLSDKRDPLYHSHDEIPATMLKTNSGQVDLKNVKENFGVLGSPNTESFSYEKIPFSIVEDKPE